MTAVTELQKKRDEVGENSSWDWFLKIFLRPNQIFNAIRESDRNLWLKPMLILSALLIILSLVSGPARLTSAQMSMTQPPEDFQYWTTEQQSQFFEGQQAMQGPLFIYIFPLLGSLVSFWLGWFILSSIFHLLMTFKGSRQPQGVYLNLVAWAAVPFFLRCLVQVFAVLFTHQVIDDPGLSGFVASGGNSVQSLLRILLGFVDFYALGFVALMLIGAPVVSGLKPKKSLWVAGLGIIIFIILAVMPKFIISQMGGLGTIRPFFLF